jgi:hypothetical protein
MVLGCAFCGVLIINYTGDGYSSTSFDWCALSLLVPTQLGDPSSLQGFLPLLCAMEGDNCAAFATTGGVAYIGLG